MLRYDNKNFCQAPDLSTVGSGLVGNYVSAVKQRLINFSEILARPPVNINFVFLYFYFSPEFDSGECTVGYGMWVDLVCYILVKDNNLFGVWRGNCCIQGYRIPLRIDNNRRGGSGKIIRQRRKKCSYIFNYGFNTERI